MLGRLTEQIPVNLPRHYTCTDVHALILQEWARVGNPAMGRDQSGKGHQKSIQSWDVRREYDNTDTPAINLYGVTFRISFDHLRREVARGATHRLEHGHAGNDFRQTEVSYLRDGHFVRR